METTESVEHGADAGLGNLLGIQPAMTPAAYASADALFAKLAGYLDDAGRRGWVGPRTIAVFPEYIGTWLVVDGKSRSVQLALTEGQAWRKHALARRIARSGARHGINVFLRGALWDLGSDGLSLMVSDGVATETGADGAALLNLWLPGEE